MSRILKAVWLAGGAVAMAGLPLGSGAGGNGGAGPESGPVPQEVPTWFCYDRWQPPEVHYCVP